MNKDICDLCMQFCSKYKHGDSETFESDYKNLMSTILKQKFLITNKNARDEIMSTLGCGNWKHLWPTDEEKEEQIDDIFSNLMGEIFYCSDRWSWDRVLRVNWLYLRYDAKRSNKHN